MSNAISYASRIVYGTRQTLDFTVEMAHKYKDLPGVWCEMGVAAGAHIIAMASISKDKKIYAFDSYDGIPLASNRDDQLPGLYKLSEAEQKALPDPGKQVLESSGATVVPLENFWENVYSALGIKYTDPTNIIAVKGWFELTVPIAAETIEPISILRLDSDLYNSTWVCLQHLFSNVIKGGVVIIDDWSLPGCRAACDEYFALIGYEPDYHYLSDICYFYK